MIVVVIIFGMKSCQPRVKEQPTTESGSTQTETERLGFINANIEFTCEIIKNPDIKNDKAKVETGVRETFKKYSLPVENNELMVTILKRYQNDTDIAEIIRTNVKPCAEGGEPIFIK